MRHLLRRTSVFFLLLAWGIAAAGAAYAQDQIGGPYEPDSNTVLLMHFDGNLENVTDQTADGEGVGNLSYITDGRLAGLGQQLYVNNGSQADSSFITIADTAALDLTGSWTIELWVNVFTFGDTNEDWRWQPRIMFKPGEPFYYSNYYITMWGGPQHFKTGYYTESGDAWQEIESPDNSMIPGNWYHITFIRDTTQHVVLQMLHNIDRELIYFEAQSYDPITGAPPRVNDNPLYIGSYPEGSNFFLDGFMDELRISDTVRNFAIPPIITNLAQLPNQQVGEATEVTVDLTTIGEAAIQDAVLHYRVDGGAWQETTLAAREGATYAGQIPGQPLGSVVEYYVSAETDGGLRATAPALAEDDEPVLSSYAVWQPETQTLYLSFEEGEGTPVDHSGYGNEIVANGDPAYAPSDVEGSTQALVFDGVDDYVEIPAPAAFVSSSQFTVDFWFNADTVLSSQTRFVIKEGASWNDFNYQIWSSGGGSVIPAAYVPGQTNGGTRTGYLTGLDSTYTPGEWYRVVYVMEDDSTYSRLYNADNELIEEQGGLITGEVHLATGAFRIGAHSPAAADANADGLPDGPLFKGLIDEVKVYNYVPDAYRTSVDAEDDAELPEAITLAQNFPNPFNPTTTIAYTLPRAQEVTVRVYDVLGREVMTLVDGLVQAGTHQVRFDAGRMASGVYFYQLKAGDVTQVRKMLLMK